MALCRVFVHSDGTVQVMQPNPRLRGPEESAADFVERICSANVKADPSLAALAHFDMDADSLPPRETRGLWRASGQSVVIGNS